MYAWSFLYSTTEEYIENYYPRKQNKLSQPAKQRMMQIIHAKLNGVKVLKWFVLFWICFIPLRHLFYVIS